MYSLILTLVVLAGHSDRSSTSMAVVDGFATQQQCLSAARVWLNQHKGDEGVMTYMRLRARATCVGTHPKP